MDTSEQLKQIKRSFRLYMNGVVAASMREKGLDYKIIWGVSQMDLRRMASEYGKDAALARELWKESIRECKLLATLVMPAEDMTLDEARKWVSEATSVELAEFIVFNLLQYIADAWPLAMEMLDTESKMQHVAAYNLVCRLLKRHVECQESCYTTLFLKASEDIRTADRQLLHALVNCIDYIASLGTLQSKQANKLLKEAGFDAF